MTSSFRRFASGPFGRLLLPAVVLQSVLIGGGYATGREIVSYGARYGPRGWIAVAAIFVGFTVTAFLTFEVARRFRAYEYKSFIRHLIGPAWPAFDLVFATMAIVVIAVMASAAANILDETLGVPPVVGTGAVVVAVGVLTYRGASVIEAFKSAGTSILYVAYLVFAGLVLSARWDAVRDAFGGGSAAGSASLEAVSGAAAATPGAPFLAILGTGILYVGYNLAVYPAGLFTLHRQRTRADTGIAALVSGLLMTVPFALTYLCLMGFYPDPDVFDAPVPWLPMLRSLESPFVVGLFGIVMGWTLLETSVGLIHALLDRIDADLARVDVGPLRRLDGLSSLQSGLLGAGVLLGAALLSRVGIIALVSRGYTYMGYAFIALYAVPLLTVGAWKVFGNARCDREEPDGSAPTTDAGPRDPDDRRDREDP